MNVSEYTIVDEAFASGIPCDLKLTSYNDAISLQAKLRRYIKDMTDIYSSRQTNPYENLEVLLIKPRTLRFEYGGGIKLTPVETDQGSVLP